MLLILIAYSQYQTIKSLQADRRQMFGRPQNRRFTDTGIMWTTGHIKRTLSIRKLFRFSMFIYFPFVYLCER